MTSTPSAEHRDLREYLRIIRHRWRAAVIPALLVPVFAGVLSSQQTPIYEASADVYLSRQNLANSLTGAPDPNLYAQPDRIAQTQADLARAPELAQRVIQRAAPTKKTATGLLATSTVSPKANSDILVFAVQDESPATAKRLAGAYATSYIEYRKQIDTAALASARREVSGRVAELERTDRAKGLVASLLEKEQQLRTMEALQTSNASVVRTPTAAAQVQPRVARDIGLGLLFGVALGVVLALVRETLDTRVRSSEEIAQAISVPLLARISAPPKPAAADSELVMLSEGNAPTAEAFSLLRANLEFVKVDRDVRTIMVTSGLAGEGKTTTIANLAVALARSGENVILADLDLRRPRLADIFDIASSHPGFTTVVTGGASLDEALVEIPTGPASAGRLQVLTAGPAPPAPAEFLGTSAVANVLESLRARDGVVLFDAPPIFAVSDPLTLSAHVDGLLLVTRVQLLRRTHLDELRRLLESARAPALGFIVTGAPPEARYGYSTNGYYQSVAPLDRDDERAPVATSRPR